MRRLMRYHRRVGRIQESGGLGGSEITGECGEFGNDGIERRPSGMEVLGVPGASVTPGRVASRVNWVGSARTSHPENETLMELDPRPATAKNPPERFTGDVWLDSIAAPRDPRQRMLVAKVRFAPGARTAWHSHALGQTLHITQGVAWVQGRGEAKIVAYPGQTLYCPPGEEHWHGASPDSFMEHLAMIDLLENATSSTTWLEHVTDEDYLG